MRRRGDTIELLVGLLEQRLDTVVYRLKFVPTVFAARQFINHGHILVNDKRVNIPSYRVKEGDVIEVRKRSPRDPDGAGIAGNSPNATSPSISRSTTARCAAGSCARRRSPRCPIRSRWNRTWWSSTTRAERPGRCPDFAHLLHVICSGTPAPPSATVAHPAKLRRPADGRTPESGRLRRTDNKGDRKMRISDSAAAVLRTGCAAFAAAGRARLRERVRGDQGQADARLGARNPPTARPSSPSTRATSRPRGSTSRSTRARAPRTPSASWSPAPTISDGRTSTPSSSTTPRTPARPSPPS